MKTTLAALFVLFLSSHSFGLEQTYYANLDDSMVGGFVGIDPVSHSDLVKRKGYRFDYSDKVLTRITFVDPFRQYGETASFFGCASVEYTWTDKNTRLATFRDTAGKAAKNDSGVFGEQEIYDGQGRVRKLVNMDPQAHVILDSYGVAFYTYEYNGDTRVSKRFDAYGKQIADGSKVWTRKVTFNKDHLILTTISYDSKGKPVASDGVFGDRYTYDNRNNLVQDDYFQENQSGTRVDAADSSGVHSTVYTVDPFGNTVRAATYGLGGKPKADKDGVFETLTKYDDDGYLVSELTKGTDGTLCEVKGVAETRYAYDARKNDVNEKRFTSDSDLSVEYRRSFDGQDRVLEVETFDGAGDPIDQYDEDQGIAYSKAYYKYDGGGEAHATYFTADGEEVVPEPDAPQEQSRSI